MACVFYLPLHDENSIQYREEVMRELENETLMENIKSLICCGLRWLSTSVL